MLAFSAEWPVASFYCPDSQLANKTKNTTSSDTSHLPSLETEKEILEYLNANNRETTRHFEDQGIHLPPGSIVVYDPHTSTLVSKAPKTATDLLQRYSELLSEASKPHRASFIGQIYEAPAETVREWLATHTDTFSHTELWRIMDRSTKATHTDSVLLNTSVAECNDGTRSKLQNGTLHSCNYAESITNGTVLFKNHTIHAGTTWEFDTMINPDPTTFSLNIGLDQHWDKPLMRKEPIAERGDTAIKSDILDKLCSLLLTQVVIPNGDPVLVGAWTPRRGQAPTNMQLAFAKMNCLNFQPDPNKNLENYLKKYSANISVTPTETKRDFLTRIYQVPPTFLGPTTPYDPFDPEPHEDKQLQTDLNRQVKEIFEKAGISWPTGSHTTYNPSGSILIIHNSIEALDLAEAYMTPLGPDPACRIQLTSHLVELSTNAYTKLYSLIHTTNDHTAIFSDSISENNAQILSTNWLPVYSGNRAQIKSGRHSDTPLGFTPDENGVLKVEYGEHLIGESLIVDPVLGADNQTIDLNLNYQFSLPADPHTDDGNPPAHQFAGEVTLHDGTTRHVAAWQSSHSPDLVHALFLTANIVQDQ